MTAIKVENIAKRYQLGLTSSGDLRTALTKGFRAMLPFRKGGAEEDSDFWALKDISFAVEEGEVLGVIGRNGAGKSTLLKLMAQITEPTSGRIKLKGRVASLLEVGTGFHQELTGRENIFLNASILGMKRAEVKQKFDEIVDFSGMEAFIDTPIKKYSSGMRVRLAFAVAAHLEPEILLIDEVLSVGDVAFQEKCLNKMNEVAGSGRTILFVSHNMAAVESLCHRCILLEEGQIIETGLPQAVCQSYLKMMAKPQRVEKKMSTMDQQTVQLFAPTIKSYKTDDPNLIKTGDCLQISFRYSIPESLGVLRRVGFRLLVNDQYGQRLFVCDTEVQNQTMDQLSGEGQITCISGPINLLSGKYNFDIRMNSALVKCKIKNFLPFDVFEGDYFGSGKTLKRLNKGIGFFAVSSDWRATKTPS